MDLTYEYKYLSYLINQNVEDTFSIGELTNWIDITPIGLRLRVNKRITINL